MDVTGAANVAAGVEAIVADHGGIDVVVNNAGITIVGSVTDMVEDDWDKELAINLKSVYLVSRAVWPHMVERGGGAILSTASIAGMWAIPADAAYCASKAAVIMLTKCMALDGANDKIRAACVCPGFINTPMIEGYFADQPTRPRRVCSPRSCTRWAAWATRWISRRRSSTSPRRRRTG